jgi:hypothetical protein
MQYINFQKRKLSGMKNLTAKKFTTPQKNPDINTRAYIVKGKLKLTINYNFSPC